MQDGLVKVQLQGPDGEVETVWARPLGDHLFELDNTPWYAYGLSWHDVIEARAQTPEGFPEFVRVARKSGHRTVRVILKPRWTGENRHFVDRSKPAISGGRDQ